ncbi:MAG TPA: hypothetical protein PL182_08835, partial [Pseudobdellovibrionaceae bacterium]|nr:hypothetical protein [Pseudobdellovibrionaceae bacterium]
IAWPLLFFCAGSALKQSPDRQRRLQKMSRRELAAWAVLLGVSVPFWGAFYGVPIGPNFYCHTLRQPPLIFWAHFIWVLFAMRLSLVTAVNDRLGRLGFVRWISNLQWNRHFGLTYLTHLPLLGLGVLMSDLFWREPFLFDLYFLSVMPVAEGLVRLFMKLRAKAA